jgi:hypothetical protein
MALVTDAPHVPCLYELRVYGLQWMDKVCFLLAQQYEWLMQDTLIDRHRREYENTYRSAQCDSVGWSSNGPSSI